MYSKINDYLLSVGFKKSLYESTLYNKCLGAYILIIYLYINDLFVTGSKVCLIEDFKVGNDESLQNDVFSWSGVRKMKEMCSSTGKNVLNKS